jgi:hypothetical protein
MYGLTHDVPPRIFTRVTVEGSDTAGADKGSWVRLSIDPTTASLWKFEKVPVDYSS